MNDIFPSEFNIASVQELQYILNIADSYIIATQTFLHDSLPSIKKLIPNTSDTQLQRKLEEWDEYFYSDSTCHTVFDIITYVQSEILDRE